MTTTDPAIDGLEVYIVGGAVRDALLGLPAGDKDWVVVGATPDAMIARGFTPVGDDFPVFLHPQTHEEYALARSERKSGRGYKGFVFHADPGVTLEQDLQRRDLTVNAIARAPDGSLIDPLGGIADVRNRVLRHVGAAFIEDPVRLLRLARFAARFGDFSIASETQELCRALVDSGEVDALVPERVWQEFAKGLCTASPARMLDVLADCTALPRLVPGLVWNDAVRAGLDEAARRGLDLAQRYALLCRASDIAVQDALRAPVACRDLARLLPRVLEQLAGPTESPEAQLTVLESCDAWRRPERCLALLEAAGCVCPGVDFDVWSRRIEAARSIDAGAIARAAGGDATRIREGLRSARLCALTALAKAQDRQATVGRADRPG